MQFIQMTELYCVSANDFFSWTSLNWFIRWIMVSHDGCCEYLIHLKSGITTYLYLLLDTKNVLCVRCKVKINLTYFSSRGHQVYSVVLFSLCSHQTVQFIIFQSDCFLFYWPEALFETSHAASFLSSKTNTFAYLSCYHLLQNNKSRVCNEVRVCLKPHSAARLQLNQPTLTHVSDHLWRWCGGSDTATDLIFALIKIW